uniref:Uncharacterized protein n=1 Tax=Romanomermis culicivorax TaxID=13658 RepID=A0A915KJQ8_ROMCU
MAKSVIQRKRGFYHEEKDRENLLGVDAFKDHRGWLNRSDVVHYAESAVGCLAGHEQASSNPSGCAGRNSDAFAIRPVDE